MPGPSNAIDSAQITGGPGTMWAALFGTAEPEDTAIGSDPGVGYVLLGATDGGITVDISATFFEPRADQAADALDVWLTERNITASTNLEEATLENLARATNVDPTTAIQDVTGPPAARSLELPAGSDAFKTAKLVLVVDGFAPGSDSVMRRYLLRKVANVQTSVAGAYRKDGLLLIPVTFKALFIDNTTSPIKLLDEAVVTP